MKKTILMLTTIILVGFTGYNTFAHPSEWTWTCTTMCIEVSNSDGSTSVTDCCGGQISMTVNIHEKHVVERNVP